MKIDSALLQTELTDIAQTAQTLEKQGYDGILSFEGQHDPFLPLALAAPATERAELITGVAAPHIYIGRGNPFGSFTKLRNDIIAILDFHALIMFSQLYLVMAILNL